MCVPHRGQNASTVICSPVGAVLMCPHVPTQGRTFASFSYFSRTLWIMGQLIQAGLGWACIPGPL